MLQNDQLYITDIHLENPNVQFMPKNRKQACAVHLGDAHLAKAKPERYQ
jgi:hypothetical protein